MSTRAAANAITSTASRPRARTGRCAGGTNRQSSPAGSRRTAPIEAAPRSSVTGVSLARRPDERKSRRGVVGAAASGAPGLPLALGEALLPRRVVAPLREEGLLRQPRQVEPHHGDQPPRAEDGGDPARHLPARAGADDRDAPGGD